jgi:hypothetical protein
VTLVQVTPRGVWGQTLQPTVTTLASWLSPQAPDSGASVEEFRAPVLARVRTRIDGRHPHLVVVERRPLDHDKAARSRHGAASPLRRAICRWRC